MPFGHRLSERTTKGYDMRLHTNSLTASDLWAAARIAEVDLELTTHGSRSRDHAFNVTLRGNSNRRPNTGRSGSADEFAATWDQWGVFLAELFDRDNTLVAAHYTDADTFHLMTAGRFENGWPEDAHGDHRFEYAGIPYTQKCKKCSATQTWKV